MKNYPLYEHEALSDLRTHVDLCASRYGEKEAFAWKGHSVSYAQFRQDVRQVAAWLLRKYKSRSHVAILGGNSYEWILSFQSICYAGFVAVPIDKDILENELQARLEHSDSISLILSDEYADLAEHTGNIDVVMMSALLGEASSAGEIELPSVDPDQLAAIFYTSGTTGSAKGVMLTQAALASDIRAAAQSVYLSGRGLLVLPLHHSFGISAAVLATMQYGRSIYINQSLRHIARDLQNARPQHIFAVPLLVEMLYRNIWAAAEQKGKAELLKKLISISNVLLKFGIDLRKRFFSSILNSLGGNLDLIVSGGAAIDVKYIHGFRDIGIQVLNGYGITECAPVVCVNRNQFNVEGSVGVPLSCNQIQIDENGEILVKGRNVMKGYYKDERQTSESIINGWFHTGDLGTIDKNGALHMTGRIKNLIILSNGENISPEEIEGMILANIDYVLEAVVSGDEIGIVAECYINPESNKTASDLQRDIAELNKHLAVSKRIMKTVTRDTEFKKTSTKKIIREKR